MFSYICSREGTKKHGQSPESAIHATLADHVYIIKAITTGKTSTILKNSSKDCDKIFDDRKQGHEWIGPQEDNLQQLLQRRCLHLKRGRRSCA
ncbi:hypothetical protein BaRGS_00013694 [Batillaria attramentaria]|uniref:Uncharacterized protein n=1 Tax=Batillaria attramentaria TaxID=370345 RepID=A0ABD0L7K8_9CAEN